MIARLRRLLGLDWFLGVDHELHALACQNELMNARQERLEAWVAALDAALWKVDTRTDVVSSSSIEHQDSVMDLKALAGTIRDEMMANKAKFPTHKEDLR